MNGFRLFLWVVGGALVVGGLVYGYQNSTLLQDLPYPLAWAALAVVVGLMFMGFADRVGKRKTVVIERVVDADAVLTREDEATNVRRARPSRRERIAARRAAARANEAPIARDARYGVGRPVMAPAMGASGWNEAHVHHERTVDVGPAGRTVTRETHEAYKQPRVEPAKNVPARKADEGKAT